MNKLIAAIALLLMAQPACAQNSSDQGFVSLFDGKSLAGWKPSTENPQSFSVKNGTIICKGDRGHLFYDGRVGDATFKNFELKLRAKTTQGSNSGVYFHTVYQEEGWPSNGFECQVNSTHTDPIKTGSLYGLVNMYASDSQDYVVKVNPQGQVNVYRPKAPSTDGQWFDYHIIVKGESVTIIVNGETTVQWDQPEDWPKTPAGRALGSGTFALQAHDPKSEVHYQDIKVKILD